MKNLNYLFLMILTCPLTQDVLSQENKDFLSEKLTKKWETAPVFNVPESVCYDPESGIIYVANIGGKPTDKDGNGYISQISPDGSVLKGILLITGLNAPKGMGIYKGTLYVTDIDRVVAIDLKSKTITKFYDFPEAKFLNDIAIDIHGTVYISDMMSTRIYRIINDKQEIWLDDPLLTNPNGLFVENDMLMIGCRKIVLANIKDGKTQVWLEGTGSIDGLEGMGDGRYLFSDWTGNVYMVTEEKKIEKLLDTTPSGFNAADIEYIASQRLLLVPTFGDNRVMAYEVK
jgi:DNA-binding beta-propeller fold protein YncE